MKKSNVTTLLLVMAAALTFFLSCSKKSNPTPTGTSVTGYWFGYFYKGSSKYNQSILFYSNGTVKVYDFYNYPTSTDTTMAYDATGTYKVTGNSVYVSDTFPNGQTFTDNGTIKTGDPSTITFSEGDVYTKQTTTELP